MADEILVTYKAVPVGFDAVGVAVNTVTEDTKELQTQIKATFSDKSIEAATKKLYEQGDVMGALVNKYGSATSALKAMEKELATMAALGQRGTQSFTELANATAGLKDTIGDTRGEIKKMASDTKVFDTMVQGARGIAAAFSVATGVAASFGSENKDLQKTLLKVQGAMAALQGVQELANIATEKGGIATKAYGVALQVVDKISKVTGMSMAASWALATGGITLVIGALTTLYFWMQKDEDKAEENADKQKQRDKEEKERLENLNEARKIVADINNKALESFDKEQEDRRKKAFINGEDLTKLELQLLKEKLAASKRDLKEYHLQADYMDYESAQKYKQTLEDRVLDTEVALKKIQDKISKGIKPKTPGVGAFVPTGGQDIEPLITEKTVEENKTNAEQMAKDIKDSIEKTKKDQQKAIEEHKKFVSDVINVSQQTVGVLSKFMDSIFAQENQALQDKKDKQYAELDEKEKKELIRVGNNAEKRKQVEEKYAKQKAALDKKMAIEEAKIKREQAIANKIAAAISISINMASAIIKAVEASPLTGGLPFSAIAAALGAVELAAVLAQPLPPIPKFESGGQVLAGGRNADGHLIGRSHREGGILIEAQGGEYIWDRKTTQKHSDIIKAAHENRLEDLVLHKYVVPMMKSKAQISSSDSYDDMLLRSTIRQSNKQMSKEIVNGISKNMSDAIYLTSRYKS